MITVFRSESPKQRAEGASVPSDTRRLCDGVVQARTGARIRSVLFALNLKLNTTRCSAVGSALGSGPRGRRFKSCHFDQNKWTALRCLPTYFFAFTPRQIGHIHQQHLCCHFLFLLKNFLPFYEVDEVSALDPFCRL